MQPVSTSTIVPAAEETDETKGDKGPKSGDYLCLGINHVTRALERDELCLIVVCKDADPPRLVQHLPYMAFLKHVPLCALSQRGSTSEMGQIFGLKTMLALGFKVGALCCSDKDTVNLQLPETAGQSPPRSCGVYSG